MIAWVDVETTCLDPELGALLEVGLVLTDDWMVEVDRTSGVVQPWDGAYFPDEVFAMHERSGLWAEARSGLPVDGVEELLATWLKRRVTEPPVMAGSTVGFDRAWLAAYMPRLEALFHYRSIDVSSLKELNRRWAFAPEWDGGRRTHRSLPDIEDSVAELRHYCASLLTTQEAIVAGVMVGLAAS